jgi:hypothetical protein
MRRPPLAREALRHSPFMEARGAYPASVEGVPEVAAITRPQIVPAGGPTTFGAADPWGVEIFCLIEFTIKNNSGLVVREGAHP